MSSLSPSRAALLAFAVTLLGAGLVVAWVDRLDTDREREQVEGVARDQVRGLATVIEQSLTASYALAALLRQGDGEIEDFDAVATEMLTYYPTVSVLALSPGGVIRQTAPFAPNRASIGFDQFADPVQGEEARRSRDSGTLTLAGPLELVQGGLGVVGRLPVFLDDPEGGPPVFWGLVNVVLPFDRVLEEAGLASLVDRDLDFELWRDDPNTGERQVLERSGPSPLPSPVSQGVELPNGTWTLAASPTGGWGASATRLRRGAAALLFALLAGWVAHLLVALRAHQRNLEAEVEARTAEIRAARNELEAMLAAVPDLLFELDREGHYLAFHSRADDLLAAPREALVGSRTEDWLPPEAVSEIRKALAEAEAEGASTGRQYALDLPQGRHWFELSVARKADPEGGPPTFMALVRDITARRAADEALRESEARYLQAQKMESVGRLAGGVAHDFNNLLTVIRGAADMAAEGLPPGHPAHGDLAQIRNSAERGAALTQQLLGTSSRQVIHPVRLDLNRAVEDLLDLIRRLIGEDIQVVADLALAPAWIRADRNQLSQVFLNLAANARDAMPSGGTLTLQTRRLQLEPASPHAPIARELAPGPWIRLRVEDSGVGMPPEVRDRAFEPFFTTKPTGRGSGLGLASVYGIVRQCGGDITLESEPGKGTRFDLWFPAQDTPLAVEEGPIHTGGTLEGNATAAPLPGRPDGRGGARIQGGPGSRGWPLLLVEDEPAIRRIAQRALEKVGYEVGSASQGEEALRLLEEDPAFQPVVLVTDVVMPGMNGVELALRLPGLPVLFTSGFADHPVLREQGLPPGSAFLPKPYPAEALVAAVASLLGTPVPGEVGASAPAPMGAPPPGPTSSSDPTGA